MLRIFCTLLFLCFLLPAASAQKKKPASKEAKTAVSYPIEIHSQPDKAEVKLGDKVVGKTPLRLTLAQGDYQLAISSASYQSLYQQLSVTDQAILVSVVLAPEVPKNSTLNVFTNRDPAEILLDGQSLGESPISIPDVTPGGHVLTAKHDDETISKAVDVGVNKTMAVEIRLSGSVSKEEDLVEETPELLYRTGDEIEEETRSALEKLLAKKHPKYNDKEACFLQKVGKTNYCVKLDLLVEESLGRDNTYFYVVERDSLGAVENFSFVNLYKIQKKRDGTLQILAEASVPIASKQGAFNSIETYRVGSGLGLGWMLSSKTFEDIKTGELKGFVDVYLPVNSKIQNVLKYQSSLSNALAGSKPNIPYRESELAFLEVEGKLFYDLEIKRVDGYENSDIESVETTYTISFDTKKQKYILPKDW